MMINDDDYKYIFYVTTCSMFKQKKSLFVVIYRYIVNFSECVCTCVPYIIKSISTINNLNKHQNDRSTLLLL